MEAVLTKQRILRLLQASPEGLTLVEVAAELGTSPYRVSGRLSKLAAYGEIEKLKCAAPFGKPKWCSPRKDK